MKNRLTLKCLLACLSLALPISGYAQPVALTNSDAAGTTSFNAAGHWLPNAAPSASNDYLTGGYQLRTPGDQNSYTFQGASLTLTNPVSAPAGSGSLLDKFSGGSGASRTLTINNLTNTLGGLLRSGAANGTIIHIAGNHFTIAGGSTILADQTSWIIDSPLLGGDSIILTNRINSASPPNHIGFSANNSGFTGSWLITCSGVNASSYVELLAANSMPGNPSVFNPAQITIGPNGILLDTAGSTFNNSNGGITFTGSAVINTPSQTVIAEPMTGAFSLTKTGAGILVLSNPSNTYTGGTIVSAGTLQLGVTNAIPANTIAGDVTVNTGLLDMNGLSLTINGLNGAGTVDNSGGGTPILTVGANGDSGTFSGVIQNSTGALSLVKLGAGTETLSGGYAYGGTTLVGAGTLNLTSSASLPNPAGNLVISNSAVLIVNAASGTALPANNVTFGTNTTLNLTLSGAASGIVATGALTFQNGATNSFNYGTVSGNPTVAAINAAGGISAQGAGIVITVAATGLQTGQFTLIKYHGAVLGSLADFSLGSLPPGVFATLVNNTANDSIDLKISQTPSQLAWFGSVSTNWDVSTSANWSNSLTGTLTVYQQYTNGSTVTGDGVTFTDALANTSPQPTNINLTGTFSPFPVIVNSSLTYSFAGAGGITGAGFIVKTNSGTLAILTSNSFTGGISIGGGSVIITNDSALGANASVVTLNGATLQINGSSTNNSRAFVIPASSVIDVSGNFTTQFGGTMTGAGNLDKIDTGTLSLAGRDTITGSLIVSEGALNIPSPATNNLTTVVTIGDTAGENATLNVTGGIFNAINNSSQFTSGLVAAATAGAEGDIRVTSGTLSVGQQLGLGAGLGGFANFSMSGGSLLTGSYIAVGFAGDDAVYNQSGGTCLISNNLMTIAAGSTNAFGVVNFSGGSYTATNGTTGNNTTEGGIFVGELGTGALNVSGSAALLATGQANVTIGRTGTGSAGTVNLMGGTISTGQVSKGAGSAVFNFNGGTLKATGANSSFVTGLNDLFVYNGGGTINDGGFAVTIAQPLITPAGLGVASIPVSNGGAGYIDTPVVIISGGTGSNVTATATVNPALGTVTAVNITCPGNGYLNGDVLTVSFAGGGANTTPPLIGTITFAQNAAGGLTKSGAGTLTLSGVNTAFTGPITNTAGTLLLNSASTYSGNLQVNGGTISLTTTPILTGSVTVANGGTLVLNQVGSATGSISNLSLLGTATLPGAALGLGVSVSNNAAVPLLNCGTLTLTGTNTISIAGALNVGVIPIVHYSSLAGSGTLTNLSLPQGFVGSLSNNAGNSTIYALIASTGPGLVWTGTNSTAGLTNLWDINSTINWLINSTPTTYHQSIIPGDAVTFNDTGSGKVILNAAVSPSSVVISNNVQGYTLGGLGTISGPAGLTKLGTGAAIMNLTNNNYSGATVISNGTLQMGNVTAMPPSSTGLLIGSAGILELAGFSETAATLSGSGTIDNNSFNTSVFTVGSGGGSTWNGSFTDNGGGGSSLIKVGNNTLIIGGTNHLNDGTLTGSSQINAGTLIITNGGVVSLSFAQFYVAQGVGSTSSVVVAGGTLAALNNFIVVGRGDVTANGTLTVNGGTVQKAGANQLVIGSLGATGRLIVNGGQVLNNGDLWLGEGPSGNGTLFLNGGLVQADVIRPNNNGGLPTNSTASTANFNGGTLQATGSSPDFLQSTALILTNGLILDDGGFTIDISSHALLSGSTPDGGLVKKGAGTVYLDATNSYSGTTQVTSGMLAGIGSLNGPVLVVPTGNLGAGNTNGPGTLTLNSAPLTLRGLATMRVSKTGGILTNDLITGVSAVSYGGTLVISNATSDGTLLAANDQFTLFSAATPSGSFGGIAGSPGAGLAYRFNSATGVLSVITAPAIAPNPTNLTFNVTGSTLKLNWPPDHEGWILQEQTNGLTTGITTNWFDVEGTANVTNTSIIISPANPTVFFRLRHP